MTNKKSKAYLDEGSPIDGDRADPKTGLTDGQIGPSVDPLFCRTCGRISSWFLTYYDPLNFSARTDRPPTLKIQRRTCAELYEMKVASQSAPTLRSLSDIDLSSVPISKKIDPAPWMISAEELILPGSTGGVSSVYLTSSSFVERIPNDRHESNQK